MIRLLVVAGAAAAVLALTAGHASSLGVSSPRLTGWHGPASVTCTPTTVTLSAAADATVDQAAALSAFGGDASLKVRAATVLPLLSLLDTNARTLVRFALPAVPDLCTVTSATLRLNAGTAAGGRTLQVVRASAAWTEGTVTWATQPATTGTAVTASSGTGWRTWGVTTHVTAMYAGTNNGFVVRDAAESPVLQSHEQVFASRTAASNRPELVVTFG